MYFERKILLDSRSTPNISDSSVILIESKNRSGNLKTAFIYVSRRSGGDLYQRRDGQAVGDPSRWEQGHGHHIHLHRHFQGTQGVTNRCRLSLLTSSALVYESQCVGIGGIAGPQPMSTAVHITWYGAQIKFGVPVSKPPVFVVHWHQKSVMDSHCLD